MYSAAARRPISSRVRASRPVSKDRNRAPDILAQHAESQERPSPRRRQSRRRGAAIGRWLRRPDQGGARRRLVAIGRRLLRRGPGGP